MNAGKDVYTLMREIDCRPNWRSGEGYGKASWDVRAIWENYSGWFHHRSTTELYDVGPDEVTADLVEPPAPTRSSKRPRSMPPPAGPCTPSTWPKWSPTPNRPTPRRGPAEVGTRTAARGQSNFWEPAWLTKKYRIDYP